MSYEPAFAGYPAQVFAVAYQTASWLSATLAGGSAPIAAIADAAVASFATFSNGAESVAVYQAAQAMAQEQISLNAVQALPLGLDPTTQAYFLNRIASIDAAASGLAALPPTANPFAAVALLAAGQPAIAYPGYLEWCVGFGAETVPSGMVSPASLSTYATGAATAWLNVTNAVRVVQGNTLTAAYDTAARQFRVASTVASGLVAVSGAAGGFTQANLPALWNGTVALPSLLLDASSLSNTPASLANQQGATIRYALRSLALQTAQLILSLRASVSSGSVSTAMLRRNETLMDLAARAAGGFEAWSAIAAINGIGPPYPGPTNQSTAASGTALLMPGSTPLSSGVAIATYAANVLGVDYDFGPINGPQPPWLGDIALIAGYPNFARALGRRIQTPIGTLIYHPGYGSRIPPEVGAVQGANEASRLAAFGAAALAADPRTAGVLSATASVQPGFLATFSGSVSPVGIGATPVGVNQVISVTP
jgi:hypothetical protein